MLPEVFRFVQMIKKLAQREITIKYVQQNNKAIKQTTIKIFEIGVFIAARGWSEVW